MKRVLFTLIVILLSAPLLPSQTAPDAEHLTRLLEQFLAGVSRAEVHDRFWADDLIYTSSSGRRMGKAEIMRGVRSSSPAPQDPAPTYRAEEVRIQQYGDAAVVAFQLVASSVEDGKPQVQRFLNTGTFLKREGTWKVVSWQATRMAADPP